MPTVITQGVRSLAVTTEEALARLVDTLRINTVAIREDDTEQAARTLRSMKTP